MDSRDLMEARLKTQRGEIRTVPRPDEGLVGRPPEGDDEDLRQSTLEADESLDHLVELNLRRLLRKGSDVKDKHAILKIAVAYIGVKAKVPVAFGGALDEA